MAEHYTARVGIETGSRDDDLPYRINIDLPDGGRLVLRMSGEQFSELLVSSNVYSVDIAAEVEVRK